MWERFTTSARSAVTQAQEEARGLDRPRIGTEHMLIALAGDGDDPAAQALRSAGAMPSALRAAANQQSGANLDVDALALLGIDLDQVRRAAEKRFGRGALDAAPLGHAPKGRIPFSASAKQALASAVRYATVVRTGSISGGHLLLGLISDEKCSAVLVLRACGIDIATMRIDTVSLLGVEAA